MQGLVRILIVSAGTVSVGLAVAGIILPMLPATPFLLLAAFCYARSSKRFHDWLMDHRWFGKYIESYRSGRGLSHRQIIWTLVPLWLSIGLTSWLTRGRWIVHIALFLCAAGVTAYLFARRRRTGREP